MKKLLSMLLAIMLLCGCALAEELPSETRTIVRTMEGVEETILEICYKSEQEFSIWYPGDLLEPGLLSDHTMFTPLDAAEGVAASSLLIVATAIAPEDADSLLTEAIATYDPASVGEIRTLKSQTGLEITSVDAVEETAVIRFYLVKGDTNNVLCITATLPLEAVEGLGVRFDWMVESIALGNASVRIWRGNDNADGLVYDYIRIADLSPDALLTALAVSGAIPEGVRCNDFSISDDGNALSLDLSAAFAAGMQTGTAGETMIIDSLVHTFLDAYDAQTLNLTVDGGILETGHTVYDFPLTRNPAE